jgi:uncharacterized protein YqgC (DUF456 family)
MPEWLNISIFALTQLIIVVGLFGLLVPIFPGIVVIWLAILGFGIVKGFSTLGIVIFVIVTILMLIGTVIDNLLMGAGARKGGASWSSIFVALIAGVLGTVVFPPLGGVIAAPLAVFLLEYVRLMDVAKAWESLRGLATGWGASVFVRFGIGVLMMIGWWIWVWKS